jgi:DNA invertase Pin-like site-specific DNA recombinase
VAEPWADTGTSTGRLMIGVLGGLADVERDLIRTRTAEGRSRSQKRGQHMGRPPKLTPAQKAETRQRRARRLPNSRAATAWARVRFLGSGEFNSWPLCDLDGGARDARTYQM